MNNLKIRFIVAGVLAALALALLAFESAGDGKTRGNMDVAAAQKESGPVFAELDTLYARYNISPKSIKSWRVQTPDKKFVRVEQRIPVPSDFMSVVFNHELQKRVAPYGVRVVATERTKERTVTMHLVKDGVVIRTFTFVMTPGT